MGASTTITIEPCAGCCPSPCECQEADLDIVIAMDPCSLACFQATNPAVYGAFSGVDFSGGYTLAYTPFDPKIYGVAFSDGGTVAHYLDGGCSEEATSGGRFLVIELYCNSTPNAEGKCLGIRLSVDGFAATYTIIDAQTDPAEWFGYDEAADFSTPCGDITILVSVP